MKNTLITTALLNLILISNASAFGLFPKSTANTVQIKKDKDSYSMSGKYSEHTANNLGFVISPEKGEQSSSVRLVVKEQEDWRGQFSAVPNLSAFLGANSDLAKDAKSELSESARFQQLFRSGDEQNFSQIIPATKSYSLVFDLKSQESRVKFSDLLKTISPTILLSHCDLGNVLRAMQLPL